MSNFDKIKTQRNEKISLLRVLKMTAYFSIFGLFLQAIFFNFIFASTSSGQDLKEVKVTMSAYNVTFDQALKQIEKSTDFKFLYADQELPTTPITIDVTNESLYNILHRLAGQYGLVFQRINNQIVIKKVNYESAASETVIENNGKIKGRVTDAATNDPLISANILIKGTSTGTATDKNGNYELSNLAPGNYTLEVRYIGYETKTATITVFDNRTVEMNFQLEAGGVTTGDVIVTTSSVIPTPVRELPNTITVISAHDIDQINPSNVAQVVRLSVPGAFYSVEGPGTTYGAFSVRGFTDVSGSASTLKVYVDGVEVSDPAYITYMDPSVIQRVEVVPGPEASTIYGSQAISGVMQIFTKHGNSGPMRLSGKIGLNTIDNKYVPNSTPLGQQYLMNATGGFDIFDYNLSVNYINAPQWIDEFGEQNLSLSGSSRFTLDKFSGLVSINYSKLNDMSGWDPIAKQRNESLGLPPSPPNTTARSVYNTYAVSISYKANENWTHNFTGGFNGLKRFSYGRSPNSAGLYSVTDSYDQRWSAAYNTSYSLQFNDMLKAGLTAGADWTQWSLPFFSGNVSDRNNYTFVDQNPGYTKNLGFFGQTQVSIGDFLFITGGLRADKRPQGASSDFAWSPRLGASYVYNLKDWMLKGRIAWGQSVVVPDASELAGSEQVSGSTVYLQEANPGLLDEVQKGYELGFDIYYTNILSFSFTYFDQKPQNLIQSVDLGTDSQGRYVSQYQNVAELKNQGFEIKAITHPVDWLTFNINFGKTSSTVIDGGPNYSGTLKAGDKLTGQPDYTLSINLSVKPTDGTTVTLSAFQFGHWIAADFAQFLYDIYGGTYNPSVKSYPDGYNMEYPKYTQINMGINQRIDGNLSGFLQIDNLTNTANYQRITGIVTQPRTISLGIQFSGITFN
jgi:outer membrane receptor protein involved in Fe transport